jgi:hypothetical protein
MRALMTKSSGLINSTADSMSIAKETSKESTVVYIRDICSMPHNIHAHFNALQPITEEEYFV